MTKNLSIDMTMVSVDRIESILNAYKDGQGYSCDCIEDYIICGKISEMDLYNNVGRLDINNCMEWICSEDEYNYLMDGDYENDDEGIMKGLMERGILDSYTEDGTYTVNDDIFVNRMATIINEEIWDMVE